MDSRLRALANLAISTMRENCGLHEYDGQVQDLSPDGVHRGLAALGGDPSSPPYSDEYDEALVSAHEEQNRVYFGELQLHHSNPLPHIYNLDLSCYDREYAPAAERAGAKRRHLAQWPDAIDASIEALDDVPAATAEALLPVSRGLADGLRPDDPIEQAALTAHTRFVEHLTSAAKFGESSAALGAATLQRLLSAGEAIEANLSVLTEQAARHRDELMHMLMDACDRIAPGQPLAMVISTLHADHPPADAVLAEATELTADVIEWTAHSGLMPFTDGTCQVQLSPPARRAGWAGLAWTGPAEPDAPAIFYVTPPETDWPEEKQQRWLEIFSRTTLPVIAIHEVAPGHFSHARALRRVVSLPRRVLYSFTFVEGWAHYAELLAIEEGYRADDPRFAAGVALEGIMRTCRMECAIGVHSGQMSIDEAAHHFTEVAFLSEPAALSEARRATFDPTYGRYTWGKLEIMQLREQAKQQWGENFTLARFHRDLLALGAPPLGLLPAIL